MGDGSLFKRCLKLNNLMEDAVANLYFYLYFVVGLIKLNHCKVFFLAVRHVLKRVSIYNLFSYCIKICF